jgi:hypothetical protein
LLFKMLRSAVASHLESPLERRSRIDCGTNEQSRAVEPAATG